MAQASQSQDERSTEEPPKGWDKNAFWYPTFDGRGGLLLLFVILFGLHFNELFGLHVNEYLIAGWLPTNLAYYLLMGVLHLGFMILLYYSWPRPTELDETERTDRTTAASPAED